MRRRSQNHNAHRRIPNLLSIRSSGHSGAVLSQKQRRPRPVWSITKNTAGNLVVVSRRWAAQNAPPVDVVVFHNSTALGCSFPSQSSSDQPLPYREGSITMTLESRREDEIVLRSGGGASAGRRPPVRARAPLPVAGLEVTVSKLIRRARSCQLVGCKLLPGIEQPAVTFIRRQDPSNALSRRLRYRLIKRARWEAKALHENLDGAWAGNIHGYSRQGR